MSTAIDGIGGTIRRGNEQSRAVTDAVVKQ